MSDSSKKTTIKTSSRKKEDVTDSTTSEPDVSPEPTPEPKIEEAPVEETKAVEEPPAPPKVETPSKKTVSTQPQASNDAKMVKAQLDLYAQMMSGTTIPAETLRAGAKKMLLITNVVLRSSDPEVLNILYKFHQDHKDGIMHDRAGLRGIESLGPEENMRVSILWKLFRRTVTRAKDKIDTTIAMKYIDKHNRGADIIDFLGKKHSF